jgi:hypothetical protein
VITQIVTLRFSELRESILNSAYKFTKHSADATLLLMGIIIRQAFSGKGIFLSDAGSRQVYSGRGRCGLGL